jgi:hypothetical protein
VQPGQYPNIPEYEVVDWYTCTKEFLKSLNAGSSGSGPACAIYNCLEAKAGQYNRGGTMAKLGTAIQPLCFGGSLIGGLVCQFTLALPSFLRPVEIDINHDKIPGFG